MIWGPVNDVMKGFLMDVMRMDVVRMGVVMGLANVTKEVLRNVVKKGLPRW